MSVENKQFEISASLLNFFDKSVIYTAFWPVNAFTDTVLSAGYKGIEWHPVRGIRAGIEMKIGAVSKSSRDTIVSLHQSYRGEKNLKQVLQHPNKLLAGMAYILLPEIDSSLSDLQSFQELVGRNLPVVLYDREHSNNQSLRLMFGERLIQPDPGLMERWQSIDCINFTKQLYERGFTGICLDLFHMREIRNGFGIKSWQDALPILLPHTKEVHVSVGRIDSSQKRIDTIGELQSLLTKNGNSEIIRMLKEIKKLKWSGRVVTEIPAASLKLVQNAKGLFTSKKDLIETHARIVENIQEILN